MSQNDDELMVHLQSKLKDLERLAVQIKETGDYSERAELFLCLYEMVSEQIGVRSIEDSGYPANSNR